MTMNTDELGNLGLTLDEEAALVAFMKTLSDGFAAPASMIESHSSAQNKNPKTNAESALSGKKSTGKPGNASPKSSKK
jgi:hypothetical protein